jgi:hypothetical protein
MRFAIYLWHILWYSYLSSYQVVLETEFDNEAALKLYESLGFIREKRLFRFYMNGKDAFRLLLDLTHLRQTDDSKTDMGGIGLLGHEGTSFQHLSGNPLGVSQTQ